MFNIGKGPKLTVTADQSEEFAQELYISGVPYRHDDYAAYLDHIAALCHKSEARNNAIYSS